VAASARYRRPFRSLAPLRPCRARCLKIDAATSRDRLGFGDATRYIIIERRLRDQASLARLNDEQAATRDFFVKSGSAKGKALARLLHGKQHLFHLFTLVFLVKDEQDYYRLLPRVFVNNSAELLSAHGE
jgi:hypothetical protein